MDGRSLIKQHPLVHIDNLQRDNGRPVNSKIEFDMHLQFAGELAQSIPLSRSLPVYKKFPDAHAETVIIIFMTLKRDILQK